MYLSAAVYTGENSAPTADAGEDLTGAVDAAVALDGTGSSDPDGDTLLFQWSSVDGPAVTFDDAFSAQPTFTPTEAGTYTFSLRVFDGEFEAFDEVVVTVTESGDDDTADDDDDDDVVGGDDDDDDAGCGC